MTNFMQNLKVWLKLAVLGGVFLVPLIIVTWQMISSKRELGIEFAQKEIYGTEYNTPVMPLIKLLQEHRGMTNGYLNGDKSFREDIMAKRTEITAQFDAIDAVTAEHGSTLRASDRWASLKEKTTNLMGQAFNLQAKDSFAQHTALIGEVIAFIAHVGDTSNLVFDPDQDSYYLMDATVFVLPELTEILGQARGMGAGIAARGVVTSAERDELVKRLTLAEYYQTRLDTDFEKAFAFNPELKGQLGQQSSRLASLLAGFTTALREGFLSGSSRQAAAPSIAGPDVQVAPSRSGSSVKVDGSAWWDVATKNIDAAFGMQSDINPALTKLLETRIAGESSEITTTIVLVLLGLAVVGVLAFFIIRDITQPLQSVVSMAEQVSLGDVSAAAAVITRKDELGRLMEAMQRMTGSLRNTAEVAQKIAEGDLTVSVTPQSDKDVMGNALAHMVNSLREMIGQLQGGTTTLSTTLNQILAAIAQVAAGASETASAVSETATTVEEVKQTTLAASQKAAAVSDSSQNAVQISQMGEQSVEEAVQGMNRVREQMESIADSVIKLGEQSRAIGDIIASVNDLADQSNLLAINAAIEAANAGEQGKGFAVVAQEVKTLADQSKNATAQVRSLLSDIQKATNVAVLVTEQGTKAVEAGVSQSVEAGGSIRQLAASIAEAAQAVSQIAASSQQQLVGMDQVVTAVESIKEASGQNIDSMGQMENASQQLAIIGSQLEELTGRYKLATNGAGA